MHARKIAEPPPASEGEFSSLSVQGSGPAGTQRLGEALLVCFLAAIHDAMTLGFSRLRPKKARRRIKISTPYGTVFISMFWCNVGAWSTKHPGLFTDAMNSRGAEICHVLDRCLATGKSNYLQVKKLIEQVLGAVLPHEDIQYVDAQIKAFLANHSASTYREATAAKDAEAILRFVEAKGLPVQAVQITAAGPRVSLPVLSSLALVPLASIRRYGGAEKLQRELDALAMRSRWRDQRRLFLPTRYHRRSREQFPGLVIDFKDLRITQGGLLDDILGALPTPAAHREAWLISRLVRLLVEPETGKRWDGISKDARRVFGTKVSELTQADAVRLVDSLEARLNNGDYTARTQADRVALAKREFIAAFRRQGMTLRFSGKALVQRPRRNRGLLSDQPDPHAINPDNRPAIVNVASGSPEEARTKATAHLEDRLARVHEACNAEIMAFLEWRAFLEDAARVPMPDYLHGHVDAIIGCGGGPRWLKQWMKTADLTDISRVIIAAARAKEIFREAKDYALRSKTQAWRISAAFPRLAELFPALMEWCRVPGPVVGFAWVALSAYYVPRWTQLPIEALIQAETGWNSHTVRNLQADGISIRGSAVELQAVKTRTGEMQNWSTDHADNHLRAGLRLMLEHSKNVDAYWERERQGVFVVLVRNGNARRVFGPVTYEKSWSRFLARHDLPHFTREQLRNQRMTARFLATDDPHEIQASMGHCNLATTSTYLRHAVLSVLNRANISKFQQQLAATIIWAIEGEGCMEDRGVNMADVNRRLMFPISDHATTEEAMLPTCDVWMANPSLPLKLDVVRIQHLARQRAYYRANWQRLRAEAPDRFEHIHRPRIEFTVALWAIVSDSPYAALLAEAT